MVRAHRRRPAGAAVTLAALVLPTCNGFRDFPSSAVGFDIAWCPNQRGTSRFFTSHRRCAISAQAATYAETWQVQTEQQTTARTRGNEASAPSPGAASSALISVLIASVAAKSVVEVGTGSGVSGLAIYTGLGKDGALTSIDADGNFQALAKEAFSNAGITNARLINGVPGQVLTRLADEAYDAIVVNELSETPGEYLEQALRLLRPGGVLIITGVLGKDGRVADLSVRDAAEVRLRELGDAVKSNEALTSVLLPIDSGLLAAIKR